MDSLRSKVIHLAYTQPELRPHLLPILKKAGWSYAVETVYLSLIPRRTTPFNIDTIRAIHHIQLDIKSDDGEGSVAPSVTNTETSPGHFTYAQEKAGMKNETVVTLSVPKGYALHYIVAIQKALPQFKVARLPAYHQPQIQK